MSLHGPWVGPFESSVISKRKLTRRDYSFIFILPIRLPVSAQRAKDQGPRDGPRVASESCQCQKLAREGSRKMVWAARARLAFLSDLATRPRDHSRARHFSHNTWYANSSRKACKTVDSGHPGALATVFKRLRRADDTSSRPFQCRVMPFPLPRE